MIGQIRCQLWKMLLFLWKILSVMKNVDSYQNSLPVAKNVAGCEKCCQLWKMLLVMKNVASYKNL